MQSSSFDIQLISQRQEEFIQMLNEPLTEDPPSGGQAASQAAAPGQQQGTPGQDAPAAVGEQAAPPGVSYIQITQTEKEAIERVRLQKNRPLYLHMQIAHFRSHVIPLRNVLLFKYLHMKESTPKSTITWSEMGTTNNQGKEVYCMRVH